MNSQNQLKEEPIAEYNAKKRKNKQKIENILLYTGIFLVSVSFLFSIVKSISSVLWLFAFFFMVIWYIFISFLSVYKTSFKLFIGSFVFVFSLAALFWFLSYKNYNVGYNEAKIKHEYELVNLTKNILSSNLSSEQQQEYLKILFAQHNAKIRIYSKKLKEKNIIYQQDFQIKEGVKNYKLDNNFKMTIPLNDDSKIYIMSYTSYKEKEKTNPFLSAITFNILQTDKNLFFLYINGIYKIIMNSLCFFIPFIVLWFFALIALSLKGKENLQRE